MLKPTFTALIGATFLAACQPVPSQPTTGEAATPAAMSMDEMVANTACTSSVPARDDWLRAERPSVDAVIASYGEVGVEPESSAVFKAYRAYMNAGQDHAAAAEVYGDNYAEKASCFA